ncbi:heme oxygenase 2 [Kwoniella heveanensis CBS 569]|nr:heme oxygenase 2 [Kwoniella heveanensis CBS 569]
MALTPTSAAQLHLNFAGSGSGSGAGGGSTSTSTSPPANSPPYTPSFQPNTPGFEFAPSTGSDNAPQPPAQAQAKTHSARGTIKGGLENDDEIVLDLSQPVSTLLRLGTQRAHIKAEHSAGAAALVQGGLGLEEYIRWCAVLWRIYDALELALAENANNPVLAPTYDPALLARAPALAEDISYLLTLLPSASTSTSTSASTTSTSLQATSLPPFPLPPFLEEIFVSPPAGLNNYLQHIKSLASPTSPTGPNGPSRLLAHAYVRYLGDLSGGQFIGARVKKSYNLQGDKGTKFYYFEFQKGAAVGDEESRADAKKRLNEVKDWYRRGMDEGVGEDKLLKAELVEEANIAFSLNTDLFSVIRLPSTSSSSSSPSAGSKAEAQTDAAIPTPKAESTSTITDKVSSMLWFTAAAGVGILLNIYVQPIVSSWLGNKDGSSGQIVQTTAI